MPAISPVIDRGVILDAASLGSDIDLTAITQTLPNWRIHSTTAPDDTIAKLQGCQVAVTNKVLIDERIMAQCPELKIICVAATGTNNIDLDAAHARGISVKNAEGYSTESVAQHSIGLMLALASQLQSYQSDVNRGLWSQSPFFCLLNHPISELSGKTLGIIGAGNTGLATARIAKAMGMKILLCQRPASSSCPTDRVPLQKLLSSSDVISLHCPLNKHTQHLIGAVELQQMKPTALLINCARGGIIDEHALLHALREHTIAGAALDVLEQEPPNENHPLLQYSQRQQQLQQPRNLLLTPHIAWASVAARQRLVAIVADNIRAALKCAY